MQIISINHENLDEEHICCAISEKKGENCVSSKKAWLKKAFDDGLRFKKFNVRGKVFIEYIPAEQAWVPIKAPNYLYINCFWVSGQYKGQGLSQALLDACLKDADDMGKDGLVIISADKKRPFLSDPDYLKHKGFEICDSAPPYFVLMSLRLNQKAKKPCFLPHAKMGKIASSQGGVLYFTNQCPFSEKYAYMLKACAESKGISFDLKKIQSFSEAQQSPSPWTSYALFMNGDFVTNEILTEAKFLKILNSTSS